jgi:hypothetical protein
MYCIKTAHITHLAQTVYNMSRFIGDIVTFQRLRFYISSYSLTVNPAQINKRNQLIFIFSLNEMYII